MNKNLSLANKYRPQTFDEVSEQSSVRVILENQIKNGKVKHAYLFCGRSWNTEKLLLVE